MHTIVWEAEDGQLSDEDKAEAKRAFDEAGSLARAKAPRLAG